LRAQPHGGDPSNASAIGAFGAVLAAAGAGEATEAAVGAGDADFALDTAAACSEALDGAAPEYSVAATGSEYAGATSAP
jgi:hypothetical protein